MSPTTAAAGRVKRALAWVGVYVSSTIVILQVLVFSCSVRLDAILSVHPDTQPTVRFAQVFWTDQHDGQFGEMQSRRFRLQSERNVLSLTIPSDTDAVRIDPLEQHGTFETRRVRVTSWGFDLERWGDGHAFDRWETSRDVTDVDRSSAVFRGRSVGLDPQISVTGLRDAIVWHWLKMSALLGAALLWLVRSQSVAAREFERRDASLRLTRRLTARIAAVAFMLFLLETGSAAALWIAGRWPATSFDEQYQSYLTRRSEALPLCPHPYFGYSVDPDAESSNNLGFRYVPDLPYRRRAPDFVIGIFGGSVAEAFAYALLEDVAVRASARRALFFLQPNQYVSPAKPFSLEETRTALGNPALAAVMDERYRVFERQVPLLRQQGVLVFDLTDAFATEPRAVYVDSCCHLNLLGNRILADRIIESVVEERTALFPQDAGSVR